MKKILLLIAAILLFPLGAQAATVDMGAYAYTLSDPASAPAGNVDLNGAGLSKQYGFNFYLGSPEENLNWVSVLHGGIVAGSGTTKNHHAYTKPDGIASDELYLAIFGKNAKGNGTQGSAVFSLAEGTANFSFLWGSIDVTNFVTVLNGDNKTYTISGWDVLKALGYSNPDSVSGIISQYFSLTDLAGIKSVLLSTCYDAFEVARISTVPLPASVLLFGSALAGLGLIRRKKVAA